MRRGGEGEIILQSVQKSVQNQKKKYLEPLSQSECHLEPNNIAPQASLLHRVWVDSVKFV